MKLIDPRLLHQAKSSRAALGLTIAFGFVVGIFTVVQAWVLSRVINGVFLGGTDLRGNSHLLGLLLLLFFGRAAALWAGEISAKRVALKIKTSLRDKLYTHIQELGPLYARAERTGELVNTATEGIEALDAYFSEYLPQLVLAALVPLTYLFFIFPLDRLSGIVLLLTAPLIPVFMILIGDQADTMTKRQWRTLSRMSAHFLDILQGLTTLKLFGRSRAQIGVIRQVSEQFRARTMGVLRVAFLSALVLEMVATLSTAIIAVEIGLRLLYGRMAFEQALFVLLLAPEFYLPLRLLGTRFHAGVAGVTAAARVFEILDHDGAAAPITSDHPTIPAHSTNHLPVAFDFVSYTYPDGRAALQDISFTIEPGQKVALVGPSGAGKSTVAALLLGWIQPSSGQLLSRAGAEEIAWLPQNPYLFHDTIAANIRIARPQASMDEVIAAAKAAQAHEFILRMAPAIHKQGSLTEIHQPEREQKGYSTVIGERGTRLSGGQAQRIALARAFLMDAPFVILDEPTAHLDPELETLISDSLGRLLANRTALLIAHRINTVRDADKIIVMDEGRVVEQGNYDDLIAQQGLFHSLVATGDRHSPISASIDERQKNNSPPLALIHQPIPSPLPSSPQPHPPHPASTLQRLLSFLRPNLGWIVISVTLGFLTIASSISLMGTSAYIISAAALQPSIAALQVPIVGVRFFGISRGLFRYLERLASHHTTFRVLAQLRVWFYMRLEPLAPARLQQHHSGDLLARIIGDINTLENFYIRVVAPPLTAVLIALFSGILLLGYAPQLTLVFWIFYGLAGILLPCWMFRLACGPGAKVLEIRASLSSALVDGLQGLPDLLSFGRGPDHLQHIHNLGVKLAKTQAHYTRLSGMGTALMNLFTNLGIWALLVLAIPLVTSAQIGGVYLAVIALITFASFEAVQSLPLAAQYLEENLRAAGGLFEIVDTKPEVVVPPDPHPLPEDKTLAVQDLAFSYDASNAGPRTLDIASFTLAPTRSLAVIGPSGSGKSTLLNLLLRFWDFQEGQITLSGLDIRSFNQEDLRSQFAVVSQHTHLFNASLRENLLIARPNANQNEIVHAAQNAQINAFIEQLPEGYETLIGEQGLRLSGGERQRIAIARALLKNAPILLLDEPTANLDPITELAILESIHKLMEGRSTLMVTHRLAGMEWMDEILVLRDGEIIERGRHVELLAQGDLYRRMWDQLNQVIE